MMKEQKITDNLKYDYITAKSLIKLLLDIEDLHAEIKIKDEKTGEYLHDISIVALKSQGLGSLIG